jgi:Ser/Thr protein kinase RdoA (MazF antagonist)
VDAAEIARRFALGPGAILSDGPVARGRMGHVWRLETADGSWAVKVPFESPIEDEVRVAAALQEAAYAAGVPTPQVRRTMDGSVFATLDGIPVRVYEWVELRPPDLRLDPALVGAAVAAMHQVADPAEGPVESWYAAPVGADAWDHLIERLRTERAPFAERLAALRDELVALESWIEPVDGLRVCHRDLWADNVLPTAAGGICVIDWENTGPADPSQELACVLFEFARGDAGRARALMAAYRDAGGPARIDRRGHFSMLIAQLGHIAEIAGRDWLEPNPRSPTRDGAAAWIGEVLDDPHTPDRLDALLAAVRDG